MKQYIGVKIINAEECKGYNNKPINENVMYPTNALFEDGYKVIYEDGYISWSPKSVFEKAYKNIELESFPIDINVSANGNWQINRDEITMEENKYYTPTIDEFYIGFEYEKRNYDQTTFSKYSINDSMIFWTRNAIQDYLDANHFRVKYLDKEDIESLGFKYGEYSKLNTKEGLIELYYKGNNRYSIHIINEFRDCIFDGIIKNKSELKKLLKQLGIDEK